MSAGGGLLVLWDTPPLCPGLSDLVRQIRHEVRPVAAMYQDCHNDNLVTKDHVAHGLEVGLQLPGRCR